MRRANHFAENYCLYRLLWQYKFASFLLGLCLSIFRLKFKFLQIVWNCVETLLLMRRANNFVKIFIASPSLPLPSLFKLCPCGQNWPRPRGHIFNISYNINVLQQTACLVVNPITVGNLLSSLIARHWVGLHTLWWFRLKDLSIDEMVGAWCFGCLSGPPGFTCWISFAPVFSFIYWWVLIFDLSPCYILIYMF